MYLHDAIDKILSVRGRPIRAADIAYEINNRKLYQQRNGSPVPSSQIHARVNKVNQRDRNNGRQETFYKKNGHIGLSRWRGNPSAKSETEGTAAVEHDQIQSQAGFDSEEEISSISFLSENGFRPLGVIRDLLRVGLPSMAEINQCGLYAITVPEEYDVDFIEPGEAGLQGNVIDPWPISKLEAKWVLDAETVYFGIAGARSMRSLRKRLCDLLRHGQGNTSDRGPHKGGEILWQLEGYGNFTVWILPTEGPPVSRNLEIELLKQFEKATGKLPFANRKI